jgi:uncharacterized protein YbjT (DUF2867 family)
MRIVMTGASGLVGGLLLPQLAGHQLTLVGRREVSNAPAGTEQLVGEMKNWTALVVKAKHDVAICCLGTTIRVAGSKAAFAAVDRDAVITFAEAAKAAGVRQFLMITSVGANADARNFYLKTKGEAEAGVAAVGFGRVDIFRPGLLRGNRQGASRPGEGIMMAISPITDLLTPHVFDQYRSIGADSVAGAIAACVGREEGGVHIHENRDILAICSNNYPI